MKLSSRFILLSIPLLALLSCSTTRTAVRSSWKAPGYAGMPGKILVVALSNDELTREHYEQEFVKDLQQHGVTAIASYTVFPSTGLPAKSVIAQEVGKTGADTVLVTRLIERKDVPEQVPGSYSPVFSDFSDFYANGFDYVYNPGYTVVNKSVVLQTNLYAAKDSKLLWRSLSDTISEGSTADIINSFIKTITERMMKDQAIR